MAQPARAVPASPAGRNRAPVTGMLLAALFTLFGVLGLQGVPTGASPGGPAAPAPVAAPHHAHAASAAAATTATTDAGPSATGARSSVDDTCTTACGSQPPRAGRAAPGEWHAPFPGGASVPPCLVLPLPDPRPPLPASPGAFSPPQHCAHHSGRGPPPPTGI
ncbi:hypothetical protein ACFYXC_15565 [Streptomyces sp. NPDC002701]|uniref:hypothetical protein n=1 Tax=Streptomyces sp. NPDC002701 TaxID=3364661 RepID=UPI0036857CD1